MPKELCADLYMPPEASPKDGMDSLVQALDSASSVVLRDLHGLGQHAMLQRASLTNLLRSRGMNNPWEVVERLFAALESIAETSHTAHDRPGDTEIPARLLVRRILMGTLFRPT